MNEPELEAFWAEVLSRNKKRTRAAFRSLKSREERDALIAHLNRMATEEGWAEPQRVSALYALDALQPMIQRDKDSNDT